MTYPAYDGTKPDPASQNGTAFGTSIRQNMKVLRDYLATIGMVPGWRYYKLDGTGSASQPQYAYYRNGAAGAEAIRVELVWGTVGGEAGNVTKMKFHYASNETTAAGSFPASTNGTYEGMVDASGYFVMTLSYDTNGYCTATTWGTT
jgi:hypothetical protein